ncbi:hypothetical protein K4K52_012667 [Colletotrichum sp. SAR 10_76]|nr:hypothetical protein K4K52_012667 [Colletotrichum sp. SAR 10_76]
MSLDGNQKKRPAESTSNEESTAKKSKTTPATGHASTASVTDAGAHISPDKLMTCLKKIAIAHSGVMVVNPQLLDDIAAGGHDAPQDVKDTVKTFSSFIMPLRINQHDWTMTFLVVDAEEPRAQFHDPAASITNAEEAKRVVAAFLLQFFPHRAPDLLLFSRSFTPAYGLTSAKDSGVIMFLIVVSDRFAPISVNISLWRYVMAGLLGESSDWSELLSLDRKPPDMPEEPVRESGASTLQLMEWKREHDEWWYHRMEALMARAASDMNDAYESLNTVVEARTSLKPVLQAMKIRQTKALGHEKQTSCPKASEKALEELERVITEISNVLSRLKNKEDELRTVAQECAEEKKQLSLFS